MKKRLPWSIGFKLILCYVLLLILPLTVITMYFFQTTTESLHTQSTYILEGSLQQISMSITGKLSGVERAVQLVATDRALRTVFSERYRDERDRLIAYQFSSSPLVQNVVLQNSVANAIYIYNGETALCEMTDSYFSIRKGESPELFEIVASALEGGEGWRLTHDGPVNVLRPSLSPQLVLSYRQSVHAIAFVQEVATVEMIIDVSDMFSELAENLGGFGTIFVVDEFGAIIAANDPSLYRQSVFDYGFSDYACGQRLNEVTDGSMMISVPIQGLEANVVAIVPIQNVSGQVRGEMLRVGALAFGLVVCSCVAVSLVTKYLLKRIRGMVGAMREVRKGNLGVQLPVDPRDEIGSLAENFNYMTRALEKSMQEVYQAGLMEREAELHALEAQINPHFLFNTLATITWIARAQDSQEIVETADALAQFYRLVLSNGVSVIPFADEMRIVKAYLQIQKTRFESRFDVEYDIEPEAESFMLIKNILQPLVENALEHGIDPKLGHGTIRIAVKVAEQRLSIIIVDDGVGMSEERRRQVLSDEVMEKKGGYAIYNILKRFQTFYRNDFEFSLHSTPGKGTAVNIVLPPVVRQLGGGQDV